jgi:hypothetical protein
VVRLVRAEFVRCVMPAIVGSREPRPIYKITLVGLRLHRAGLG